MVKYKEINLEDIKSNLINNLDDSLELEIPLLISKKELLDFNIRNINPNNIEKIKEICDFLDIENTLEFLIMNSKPGKKRYPILDNLKLPEFMTGIITLSEMVEYNALEWFKCFVLKYSFANVYYNIGEFNRVNFLEYLKSSNVDMRKKPFGDNTDKWIISGIIHEKFEIISFFIRNINEIKINYEQMNDFSIIYQKILGPSTRFDKLSIFKYVYQEYFEKNNYDISNEILMNILCCNISIDFLKFIFNIIDNDFKNKECLKIIKARLENVCSLEYLKFLLDEFIHQKQNLVNSSIFEYVITGDNIDCLKYLHINGYISNSSFDSIIKTSVRRNFIRCSKYLIDNNFQKDKYCCAYASENGNIEMLKYLREKGCLWDESTVTVAAACGHFDCLKFALDNNCPFKSIAYKFAIEKGYIRIANYLNENNYPYDEKYKDLCERFFSELDYCYESKQKRQKV